ncbi:MAG: TonB family protein [Flavobacteriales bacterium]|nr:TonB family protein [Flavobacteriales bacterium]
MSEMIYIQDDFGNQIPMLDAYGNFSVHVLMLYAEDKLSEADRKTVNAYADMDEMAKDALEGYALSTNPSKTRFHLGQLNADIQKRSGAAMVTAIPKEKSDFDYRKLAAAVALLVVIGGASFFGAKYFSKEELADNTPFETVSEEDSSAESESGTVMEQPVEETGKLLEKEVAKLSDSEDQNLETEPVVEALSKAADTRNPDKAGQAETAAAKAKEKQVEKSQTPPAKAADKEAALADAVTGNSGAKKDAKGGAATSTVATNQAAQQMREETAGASRDADEVAITATQQNRLAAEQSSKSRVENDRQAQKAAASDPSSGAIYPGGDISMYKFIEKKKIYSDVMLAQNLTGSITVSFDIETDGRVSNAQIKSGTSGLLNEDALRVVRSMPKWKPAMDAAGKSVKTSKTVVIKYGN